MVRASRHTRATGKPKVTKRHSDTGYMARPQTRRGIHAIKPDGLAEQHDLIRYWNTKAKQAKELYEITGNEKFLTDYENYKIKIRYQRAWLRNRAEPDNIQRRRKQASMRRAYASKVRVSNHN